MYAIEHEDNLHEETSILPDLAADVSASTVLMVTRANEWAIKHCPPDIPVSLMLNPHRVDVVVAGNIMSTFTAYHTPTVFTLNDKSTKFEG